jgi:hypothetical protein
MFPAEKHAAVIETVQLNAPGAVKVGTVLKEVREDRKASVAAATVLNEEREHQKVKLEMKRKKAKSGIDFSKFPPPMRHVLQVNNNNNNNNNNKHAYAGTNDCFTHIRVLLVLQALRHCGPI